MSTHVPETSDILVGVILKLVDHTDPALRTPSKKVIRFDKKLEKFASDMIDTLLAQDDPEGVGLAAPQVGKNIQFFLVRFEKDEAKDHMEDELIKVVINPRIISKSKAVKATRKQKEILEGCLSLPHYYGPVARPNKVTIEYQDVKGNKHKQKFVGFPASIILHEIDHLNGVLFVDRILEQKSKLYEFDKGKWYEVDLP